MSWDYEEQEMDNITLQEFEELCAKSYGVKDMVDALEDQVKGLNETKAAIDQRIIMHMQKHNKTSYKTQHGTVIAATRFGVSLPKDPDQLDALYGHLKKAGHFENLISINHMKLNSYYKQEMEVAKEKGDFDFKIPGVDEPKAYTYIQLRSK